MLYLICFALCASFMVACDIYDVTMTTKGLKAGVALEGFTWLIGPHPSARALYLRDALVMFFAVLPSLVALLLGNKPVAYGALAGPVAAGIKHILGGLAWRKLNAEGREVMDEMTNLSDRQLADYARVAESRADS